MKTNRPPHFLNHIALGVAVVVFAVVFAAAAALERYQHPTQPATMNDTPTPADNGKNNDTTDAAKPIEQPTDASKPQTAPPAREPFPAKLQDYAGNFRDDTLSGFYQRDGLSVAWKGKGEHGAEPIDIVEAIIHRLEWEQTTDLASDQTSRAIVALMRASDILEGTDETTDDGIPVIK